MEARTKALDRQQSEVDVWAQLQQKESDILLAAELGKALLEKNEELVKQHEKLIEDYSMKIEVSTNVEKIKIISQLNELCRRKFLKMEIASLDISFPNRNWVSLSPNISSDKVHLIMKLIIDIKIISQLNVLCRLKCLV